MEKPNLWRSQTMKHMQVSVDISLYPLVADYEPPIIDFIQRLNQYSGFDIHTNQLSTQLSGDYDQIMSALTQCMKESLASDTTMSFVLKVLNVSVAPGAAAALDH